MTTKTIRRISAVIAAVGFLLMLTEPDYDVSCAINYIGLALFGSGSFGLQRTWGR